MYAALDMLVKEISVSMVTICELNVNCENKTRDILEIIKIIKNF